MKLKINLRRMLLLFIILGAYWYRFFTVGWGRIGTYLYTIVIIVFFLVMLFNPSTNREFSRLITNKNSIKTTWYAYGIIIVYSVLSIMWAMNRTSAIRGMIDYILTMLIIIIIAVSIRSEREIYYVCNICTVNVFLISVMAIYEAITGNYIFSLTSNRIVWVYSGMHSPIVQYNHPNNLATALLISYPLCVIALNGKGRKHTVLLALLTGMLFVIFFATDSRFAILIFLLYFVLQAMHTSKINKKLIYCAIGILALIFVFMIFGDAITDRINLSTMKDDARLKIWQNAINNFVDSYGLGVGVGNAETVNQMTAQAAYIGRPCHNYILEMLEELGVVGAGVWISWYISMFKANLNIMRENNDIITKNCFDLLMIFLPMSVQQSSLLGSFSVWMIFGIVLSNIKIKNKLYKACYFQDTIQ